MKNAIFAITLCVTFSYATAQGHSGFDMSQLDTTAALRCDFAKSPWGGGRRKNPLPADKARYNRYEEMAEGNQKRLREILETAAKSGESHSAMERQVGDD